MPGVLFVQSVRSTVRIGTAMRPSEEAAVQRGMKGSPGLLNGTLAGSASEEPDPHVFLCCFYYYQFVFEIQMYYLC